MNHPIETIIGSIEPFIDKLFKNLDTAGIDLEKTGAQQIDHIGTRTISKEQYENIKQEIISKGLAEFMGEVIIRGRAVGTLKLNKPIVYKDWSIEALELLAPADGDEVYEMGPQHIEVVTKIPLKEIETLFPHVIWKLARPESHNPELSTKFKDGSGIKFHPITLLNAVKYEQENDITEM